MRIITKLSPNNKFQLKAYRLAEGYGRAKKEEHGLEQTEKNYIAQIQQKIEDIHKVTRLASEEVSFFYESPSKVQPSLFPAIAEENIECDRIEAKACTIPQYINLYKSCDSRNESDSFSQTTYREIMGDKVRYLDLLKKSQQNVKKERPWGKPTRLKSFLWSGGQKILEGGAIIDRFAGADNATMLTLTLPGDNWYCMDALARWSGYVVNRLCQVIRRVSRNQPPIYWFFVWEHQKRGALHMHWCIGWRVPTEVREALAVSLKDKWFQLLKEIGKREDIDMFAGRGFAKSHKDNPAVWQWDVQQVKHSVAGYFAKYCQKNIELNGEKANEKPAETDNRIRAKRPRNTSRSRTCPTRYWGSCQNIKSIAKKLTNCARVDMDNYESGIRACEAIRNSIPSGTRFRGVSVVPFEVIDENSGICIASGVTETYYIEPEQFPAFHRYLSEYIIERPWNDDPFWGQFEATGASMRFDLNGNYVPS